MKEIRCEEGGVAMENERKKDKVYVCECESK